MEAACSLAVHDAEFRRYYQRKKAESKTHAHLRALAFTARKLVRLVDHLLRSNRLYNPLGAPRSSLEDLQKRVGGRLGSRTLLYLALTGTLDSLGDAVPHQDPLSMLQLFERYARQRYFLPGILTCVLGG